MAITLTATLVDSPADACETICAEPKDADHYLRSSDRVFVGRVTAVAEETSGRFSFTLQPIRWWKGKGSEVSVYTFGGAPSCGKQLSPGAVYFVALAKGQEEIKICSPLDPVWEQRVQRLVTRLDRARGFPPLSLPPEDLQAPWERR